VPAYFFRAVDCQGSLEGGDGHLREILKRKKESL
jgi:hypothetical protein